MHSFSTYTHAKIIRFLKFFSGNIISIVIPLAIFNITHDLSMAGISVLLEWIPKIALYLMMGQIVSLKSESFLKKSTYLLKLLALILGYFAIKRYIPWYYLLAVSPFSQLNAAVFNVLYEVNSKKWSGCDSTGHAEFLKLDNLAGVCALVLCFILKDVESLMLVDVLVCMLSVYWVFKTSHMLYDKKEKSNKKFSFKLIFSQLRYLNKPLWYNTLLDFCFNVPIAVLFAAYPFYIANALNVSKLETSDYSLINIARTFICFVFLHVCAEYLKKSNESWKVFKYSIALSIGCTIGLCLFKGYTFILISMMFGAVCFGCYPWIRGTRQKMSSQTKEKHAITAVVTALKSIAYLVAGGLMMIHTNPITIFGVACLGSGSLGGWALYQLKKQPIQVA